MERYETEEQQVEAIKDFWKENGTAIILGAVLGLGGLWGWRYYNDYQLETKAQASFAYNNMVENVASEGVEADFDGFVAEHGSTAYGPLALLIAAQRAVDEKDFAAAEKSLNDAVSMAKSDAIADISRIRLARVQATLAQYVPALDTLSKVVNTSFSDQVEEVKGDIFVAQKDFDKARIAYSSVLSEQEDNADVAMKLSNIAYAATQVTGDASEN